jgi:O-antigen/teichoic acid export membrane protein
MSKFHSQAIWSIADQGVLSATRFLVLVLLGYWSLSPKSEIGTYSNAFSLLLLFVTIQDSFLTTPLTVIAPRLSESRRKTYVGNTHLFSNVLSVSLIPIVLLLPFIPRISSDSPNFGWVCGILGITLPAHLLREFHRRWQFSQLQIHRATLIDVSFCALQILGFGLMIAAGKLTAASALAVVSFASICIAVAGILSPKDTAVDAKSLRDDLNSNIVFGRWIAGANLAAVAQTYCGLWWLTYQVGTTTASLYSTCLSLVLLVNPFLLGITSLLAPKLAHAIAEGARSYVVAMTLKFILIVIIVLLSFTAGLWIFGDRLMVIAFGTEFSGQGANIVLLSLVMVGQGTSYVLSAGLRALHAKKLDFAAALAGTTVSIVVTLLHKEPTVWSCGIGFLLGTILMVMLRAGFFAWMIRQIDASLPVESDIVIKTA